MNKEIPKLNSYEKEPKNEFWSRFPFNPMPTTAKQNQTINPEVIKSYTDSVDLPPIFENIKKDALNSLFNGADLLVDEKQLKPMKVDNSKSIMDQVNGQIFTDILATLVKEKKVAGPYLPPIENMRVNQYFCVKQDTKVRPICNLSLPEVGF